MSHNALTCFPVILKTYRVYGAIIRRQISTNEEIIENLIMDNLKLRDLRFSLILKDLFYTATIFRDLGVTTNDGRCICFAFVGEKDQYEVNMTKIQVPSENTFANWPHLDAI